MAFPETPRFSDPFSRAIFALLPQVGKFGGVAARDTSEQRTTKRFSQDEVDQIRRSPPLLMSLQEAAIYLGIGTRKLRYDCKRRLIPYVKLGGKFIFKKESLDAAIDRLEVRSVGG